MCDSCIKRIFHDGPNTCPIAGCGKYLRPNRFKIPRFEDLAIERECDIRARVSKTLNHTELDFESLRQFNDYEEWKEEMIMSLVEGRDVEHVEKQLREYAKENAETIKENAEAELEGRKAIEVQEARRLERSELARAEAVRERAEEAAEREAGRKEMVDRIVNSHANVLTVAKEAGEEVQRRTQARSGALEAGGAARDKTILKNTPRGASPSPAAVSKSETLPSGPPAAAATALTSSYKPSGLKKREPKPTIGSSAARAGEEKQVAYDPFEGMHIRFRYYTLLEGKGYHHTWSNGVDTDPKQNVGGLRAIDYQRRAQLEAHAGLGVFIGDEKCGGA